MQGPLVHSQTSWKNCQDHTSSSRGICFQPVATNNNYSNGMFLFFYKILTTECCAGPLFRYSTPSTTAMINNKDIPTPCFTVSLPLSFPPSSPPSLPPSLSLSLSLTLFLPFNPSLFSLWFSIPLLWKSPWWAGLHFFNFMMFLFLLMPRELGLLVTWKQSAILTWRLIQRPTVFSSRYTSVWDLTILAVCCFAWREFVRLIWRSGNGLKLSDTIQL